MHTWGIYTIFSVKLSSGLIKIALEEITTEYTEEHGVLVRKSPLRETPRTPWLNPLSLRHPFLEERIDRCPVYAQHTGNGAFGRMLGEKRLYFFLAP